MAGDRVTGNVGGNLSIETKQERNTYEEKNTSAGVSMNYGVKEGKTSLSGGASRGNTKSNYESAKDQSGIRAGKEGYDITVKDNTHLKGGLIDSDAAKEKNTLTTGTLTWEDMDNKADYKAGGAGISYTPKDTNTQLNQKGLTPSMTPTVKGKADSTTKSAVADGTITITDKEHQKQDVSTLNRDTKNALNQLEDIFDKTKVEEKQELIGMLEKYGNQAIHKYAESKGWEDGSTEKMLLHGAFGALMGDMAGGSAASGALSGSVNEYVIGYLTKTKGQDWVQKHPDTVQWISAGVGAAIGKLSGKDVSDAINIALTATKWNELAYERLTEDDVKKFLCKKSGQQMTDKEIEGLLLDILVKVRSLDPEADQSKYWEYGNKESENAVVDCLKEHGIDDENIARIMDVYFKEFLEAHQEDLNIIRKTHDFNQSKSDTLGNIYELPSINVTAKKNHSLSEECNHSDWYEAKMDLERNLAADLADSRENFLTKLALKSPEVSMMNYSGLKTVGFIGAEASERTLHTPIASQFLKYSLAGSGKPLSFAYGSDVSKDLENSEILATKVKELARNIKPGEKKYFYSSMDFNGGIGRKQSSKDQQLAYGKVKLAISIEKDKSGHVSYMGEVGDTYNFDWHELTRSNYQNEHIKLVMNNGAVIYQKIGALQPFNWTASIKGHI